MEQAMRNVEAVLRRGQAARRTGIPMTCPAEAEVRSHPADHLS